ncbi:trehalose-phosphatase [Rhodococcus sp. NM-2]|uniref:trehalose-phosphatase n=1 Tax=Rhodococcus sp. NM-2 TaxID=3401174 RepID=UPI003AB03492
MSHAAIDLRRHDAVLFDLDVVMAESARADTTRALVRQLQSLGVATAVFSTDRDVRPVLDAARIADVFPVRVDGASPVDAADRLGARPGGAVVVTASGETAAAATRGGFALVIGVGHDHRADDLRRCGADIVVVDPSEIPFRAGDLRLSEIPDALTSRHELPAVLRVRRPAVFLDFDGTLANIVSDPAKAVLVDGVAAELARLTRKCPVAVISGRDLADVQTRVGMAEIWYAGSHGFELAGPQGQYYQNPDALAAVPVLHHATRALTDRLRGVPGVLIEPKKYTVAVHYRNVAADRIDEVVATVHDVATSGEVRLRVTGGRKVVELRPDVDWDKGRALNWVLEHIHDARSLLPIYVGDDFTDEDAFDAVTANGVGIVVRSSEVGDRRSAARFAVTDPVQVRVLLQRLADRLGRDPETASAADAWMLFFDGYEPATEKLREAVCTLGNGYFATRGCAPEATAGPVHYPGTYLAGVYNRLRDERAGMEIVNESMVNAPNWLTTTFRIEGGPWFDVDAVDLLEYRQYLNLRRAVLTRQFRYRDETGRTTSVIQRRFVAMHLPHVCALQTTIIADLDVGVPARGLHGEAYRGHVFWDELFVFPVLNLRVPTLTRSLLRYRYRRLPEARRAARAAGYRGAMFPWQSGSDGREESQQLHLNPRSGRWLPDPSWRQHHIGIAIAYNVWHYYQVTGDLEFLSDFGAEMLVEIARFFAGLASYEAPRGRYTIRGVMGPDEFHSGYPEAPHEGVDNNAYTNVMAVWVILRAREALDVIPAPDRSDLVDSMSLDVGEMARWADVSRRMFVPFHDRVISQFEGYEALAELNWAGYRERYTDIQRLDRILEAEGDDVNRYRASKQADVLMLFYLLSADELRDLFERLGYQLEPEAIPRTIDYYIARTSHGSTLSAVVHSWVLARANRDKAMEFFDRVLASDITDIQGGTTSEGIHLAAMAGSIDLLQRCFTGLETRGDRLVFNPEWPRTLGALEFSIVYRGHQLWLTISGRRVQVSAGAGNQRAIEISCRDQVVRLEPGCTVSLG